MSRFLKFLISIGGLLLVLGLVIAFGKQAEPFVDGTESALRFHPGPLPVQASAATFVDTSRPTPAYGEFAGLPERRLVGRIWRPDDSSGAPYPLIVYSHGLMSTWKEAAELGPYLASYGYVVIAVNFPLTAYSAPEGPYVSDVLNQPADVSFLIDSLLAQNGEPGNRLEGMIDPLRIGVMGLSLGGLTTTMVTFHPELRDKRVAAALAIAGPMAMFNPAFFTTTTVPFLMVAGDIDALIPYPTNAATVLAKVPHSQLVTIHGGSHSGFANAANVFRWLPNFDAVVCKFIPGLIRKGVNSAQGDWHKLLRSPEQGINDKLEFEVCKVDTIPESINPLRQQMITEVVVQAFFQSQFAHDPQARDSARRYLSEVLPRELNEVSCSG
jgi:predicted dienelactone hydrolase